MSEFINTIDALGDNTVIDSFIDKSITEFKDDVVTTIGSYAFCECLSLEIVDLPNVVNISARAFMSCTALAEINLPNYACTNEMNEGIFDNAGLTSVCLPNTVMIPRAMFSNCKGLVSAVFPKATKVCMGAFKSCSALKILDFHVLADLHYAALEAAAAASVVIRNTEKVCALGASFSGLTSGTYFYVPRALVDSYKSATNWSTYADQFRALEDYTVDGTTTGELDETKI